MPRYEDLVAMIDGKLPGVPRFRQVVRRVPGDLGRPVWVDDPHFNIEYHVRHSALPAPGGETELRRLVGRIMSQQLDHAKPLWEIWMVDGLEGDRWALASKTHHCMVDGVSGTELLAMIMDISPDYTLPEHRGMARRACTLEPRPPDRGPRGHGHQSVRAAPGGPVVAPRPAAGRRGDRRAARGFSPILGLVRATPTPRSTGRLARIGDGVGRRRRSTTSGASLPPRRDVQ